jgi:hypothetical protein
MESRYTNNDIVRAWLTAKRNKVLATSDGYSDSYEGVRFHINPHDTGCTLSIYIEDILVFDWTHWYSSQYEFNNKDRGFMTSSDSAKELVCSLTRKLDHANTAAQVDDHFRRNREAVENLRVAHEQAVRVENLATEALSKLNVSTEDAKIKSMEEVLRGVLESMDMFCDNVPRENIVRGVFDGYFTGVRESINEVLK